MTMWFPEFASDPLNSGVTRDTFLRLSFKETNYDELLRSISIEWIPDFALATVIQFLQKPYAGVSYVIFMTEAEKHMLIDIRHCYENVTFSFSKSYIKHFRLTWLEFDPEHTGTILFEDVFPLINKLYTELEIESWKYDPSEYKEICAAFPNTVITYLEFCLWAEEGESYTDHDGFMSNRLQSKKTLWSDNKHLVKPCVEHGQIYAKTSKELSCLNAFADAYLHLKNYYLSIDQLEEYFSKITANSMQRKVLDEIERSLRLA